jgi:biopolymer transport protein ExbB
MVHLPILPIVALLQSQPDSPAATAPAAAAETMSLFGYVQAGGILSYVLILLSFIAVALMIRNILALRLSQIVPPDAVRELERHLKARDLPGALRYCMQRGDRSFLTSIFEQALERCSGSQFGALELRSAVEDAAQTEVDRLHGLNDGIGIIAAVGPMLGLLGTVIGMIAAFHTIGSLEGAARSTELARFMSMALVCTAEGLIVAIPCTVVFAMFRRRITNLVGEAGRVMETLICLVSPRNEGPVRTPARPAVATGPAAGQVR